VLLFDSADVLALRHIPAPSVLPAPEPPRHLTGTNKYLSSLVQVHCDPYHPSCSTLCQQPTGDLVSASVVFWGCSVPLRGRAQVRIVLATGLHPKNLFQLNEGGPNPQVRVLRHG
jgi:hypothetical protein